MFHILAFHITEQSQCLKSGETRNQHHVSIQSCGFLKIVKMRKMVIKKKRTIFQHHLKRPSKIFA